MKDKLLGTNEAAEMLGIHPDTLNKFARGGYVRSIRIGSKRMFALSTITAAIRMGCGPVPQAKSPRRRDRKGRYRSQRPRSLNEIFPGYDARWPVPDVRTIAREIENAMDKIQKKHAEKS